MMRALGRLYVRHINDRYQHYGTAWERCCKFVPIDSELYLLACRRYIELHHCSGTMVNHQGGDRCSQAFRERWPFQWNLNPAGFNRSP